jgi:putative transposase
MHRVWRILIELIGETLRWLLLAFRSSQSIQAENLFLRRQLALYVERGVKPRRIDLATRMGLALLSRLFDWRDALVVVRPETLFRWHRAGWKPFWRLKSRPGRPRIPRGLQALIRRISNENPSWGEERIANELLWTLQQLREAVGFEERYEYLLHDRIIADYRGPCQGFPPKVIRRFG